MLYISFIENESTIIMDHLEAVVEIKNVISTEFINKIIPLIDSRAKKNMLVKNSVENKKMRDVKGCELTSDISTDLFIYIKKEIERLYNFYKVKFPKLQSSRINQIDLLKYSVGGKHNLHIDFDAGTHRNLSVIMNLNNDYEGGDLIFADQKNNEIKRFKLSKGSIVFFPSNFMYPHMIEPIKKGTRYSIVSWLW